MFRSERVSMRKLVSIIKYFMIVLVSFIAGICIYMAVTVKLTSESIPMPLGFGAVIANGDSMAPVIEDNDLVFIKKKETFSPGDIVLYEKNKSFYISRIENINDTALSVKSDNRSSQNAPISSGNVKGTVIHIMKNGGLLADITSSPYVLVGILILLLCLIEASYYSRYAAKKKKEDPEKIPTAGIEGLDEILNSIKLVHPYMKEDPSKFAEKEMIEFDEQENQVFVRLSRRDIADNLDFETLKRADEIRKKHKENIRRAMAGCSTALP